MKKGSVKRKFESMFFTQLIRFRFQFFKSLRPPRLKRISIAYSKLGLEGK